jgi:hypothetical protein
MGEPKRFGSMFRGVSDPTNTDTNDCSSA